MAKQTLEYVAFWSGDQVAELFEAAAALMNTSDYQGLLQTSALIGFLLMMVGAAIHYRLKDLSVWAGVILFCAFALLIPKVPVTVSDPKAGTVRVVDRVPLGLAFPACAANSVSVWAAESFETALGALDAERFTLFGAAFPQRAVEALYAAGPVDPAVRGKLRSFVESCVATEILTDEGKMTALTKAPSLSDLLLSGTWVNPARRVFLDGQLYSCKAAAGVVKEALETDLEKVEEKLLLRLSGSSDPMLQEAVRKATAESEAIFLGTAKGLRESLRHAVLLNALPEGLGDFAKRSAAPVAAAAEIAKAQGNLATEINYRASAELAEAALPKLRSLLEMLVIGVFPVMIVMALALGIGATAMLRFYVVLLVWLALWAPIASVVNFLSLADADPVSTLVKLYGGVTLEAADVIRKAGTTSEAMAGTLMMLVPVISFAIAKVSDNGAAAWAGSVLAPAQSAANAQGASLSAGNVSVGNASVGNTTMNNTSTNTHDTSVRMTSGDLMAMSTPYGSATVDMSSGTVTSARRLTSDLGVSVTRGETYTSGGAETVGSGITYTNTTTGGTNYSDTRGVNAVDGYGHATNESVGNTLVNSVSSNTGRDGSYGTTTTVNQGANLSLDASNSEGVGLRQGIGVRLGRGFNEAIHEPSVLTDFPSYQLGTSSVGFAPSNQETNNPLMSPFSASSKEPVIQVPVDTRSVFNPPRRNEPPKAASILSGEISPSLSIQTGNSIRDSAAFSKGSSQNESATLRNNFSYLEGSSANISAGNTETSSETMNVGKQTGGNLIKTSGHMKVDASHQNAVKNKTQTDTRSRSIYYDDGAAVLSEAVGQFDSVQSVLRSATMYGGQSMATQLSQKIADEEGKKTLFDKADIPQVRRENLDEKYLARESEILSNYAPAHVSKPDLQEPQDEVGKVQENLNRLNAEHARRVEVANEYRNEETGLGTLGQNALLGGYGYDDPHERLKEKQEKH